MSLRFLDEEDLIEESKKIIRVYYRGDLDGRAYEETNEYVKEHDKSIFDSLSKSIDYETIENYSLLNEVTFPLTELSKGEIKDLTANFDLREGDKKRHERWRQVTDTRMKYLRVGKDWDMVKQIIKSIVFTIDDDDNGVLWFEPPFPKMSCKLFSLRDMYYKYPPDVEEYYDAGYRFTDKQMVILMDWIKDGYLSEYRGLSPIKEKWDVIRAFLKSFIIITMNSGTVWVEPPYNLMWCEIIRLKDMRCEFAPDSVQRMQGYKTGYRFTDEQVEKLLKWLVIGKKQNYKVGFLL
jgi:L-rhamnose mutarotase